MNDKVVLIPLVNLDDDDIHIITSNLKQTDHVLILSNHKCIRKSEINHIYDTLKDVPGLVVRIEKWCQRHKKELCGVITLDEEYRYRISEEIAKHFSLPIPGRRTLDNASNKLLQKRMLLSCKLKVPRYWLVTRDNIPELRYPNVIKILTGVGSTGTYLNHSRDELIRNIGRIHEESKRKNLADIYAVHRADDTDYDPKETFMVEEYVGGNEYSCDFVVEKGSARVLRICLKLASQGHFANYDGFLLYNPNTWGEVQLAELEGACQRIAGAYHLTQGVCMMDFKYDGGIVVLESTIRPGISTFTELMALTYGWMSLDIAVRQALGQPLNHEMSDTSSLAVYLTAPRKGVIRKISTQCLDDKSIMKVDVFYRSGQVVTQSMYENCGALIGYALVRDIKPEDARQWVDTIRGGVDVEIGRPKKEAAQ